MKTKVLQNFDVKVNEWCDTQTNGDKNYIHSGKLSRYNNNASTWPLLFNNFYKEGHNFCNFSSTSIEDEALPNWVYALKKEDKRGY